MAVRADTVAVPPGRAPRRRREALIGIGLLVPSAALVLGFTLFPVAYNVWLGFYAKHSLRATSTWVGLGNYAQILEDPDFWRSTWLATVYAVGSTALQIGAGVAGALILHRRFAGCDFLRGVALFPYMIPTVIAVFVWRWLMNDLYGVIPYVLSALHVPGLPDAWLTHKTIMLGAHRALGLDLLPVRPRQRAGAPADHPARAVRCGAGGRRLGDPAVPPRHPAAAQERALDRAAAARDLDVHEVRRPVAARLRGRGGGGDPDATRLHVPALVHVLPGGDGRGAVERDVRAPPDDGDDLLRRVSAGRTRRAMAEAPARAAAARAAGVATAAWALRIGLFVFCAFPLYWMLVSSLKVSHELLASPPTFWPHEWDLRAYRKLFYETNFVRYFQNTDRGGGAHHRHRAGRRHDRRLRAHPLPVPRPDAGGADHAPRLHVPAHHHAGAAVPARAGARARQLARRARPDLHLLLAAVCAVDPARVLPVDPGRPRARGDDRRGEPRPGALGTW